MKNMNFFTLHHNVLDSLMDFKVVLDAENHCVPFYTIGTFLELDFLQVPYCFYLASIIWLPTQKYL